MARLDLQELLDSADVQDPTDFPPPSTAPGLRALDSALRCKICQELYDAPIVLACGHCFCSLCARNQLSEKPACPTCWKEATVSGFRLNPAMEEAVTAWKDARHVARFVLRMVKDALQAQLSTSAPDPTRPVKRRRHDTESPESIAGPSSPRKPPRSSKPASKRQSPFNVDASDDDIQGDGHIECPVCAKRVPLGRINEHLDNGCSSSSNKSTPSSSSKQKDAWSKLLDGKKSSKEKGKAAEAEPVDPSPLPKASYTVLKDKQIRDLLSAHDLATVGDRAQLIARHERWVSLYNANLDRSPAARKRLAELRQEMRRWEEDRRASKKDPLKIDVAEYRRANKAEFDKLVERARAKAKREPSKPPDDSAASATLPQRTPSSTGRRKTRVESSTSSEVAAIVVDSDPEG
ncbi:hypothetical protein BC834DRAFT_830780 [Gloeopeniophorella convolvens]|nr:hypothetical protein BC834DRAFT_830780 [Gloeopeniophorella convolvens]